MERLKISETCMNDLTIESLFSDQELRIINEQKLRDRQHPLRRILFPRAKNIRDQQVRANTEKALLNIMGKDKPWLHRVKRRLISTNDYAEASGALGELRAYGYCLMAGLNAKPKSTAKAPTPEFVINYQNDCVLIEVHSKQLNQNEADELNQFNNRIPERKDPDTAVIKEHIVTPFGKPEAEVTITENAIHKLCQIKEEEDQLSDTATSILWLDFQDEIWAIGFGSENALPIRTRNGDFFSGAIWHAFYGWKGAPIFEYHSTETRNKVPPSPMRHIGRFRGQTRVDAVVLSFADHTIVLENPWSRKPIKPWLSKKLIALPRFSWQYSYINWPKSDLKQRISLETDILESLSREAIYKW